MSTYKIVSNGLKPEDIVIQLNAIKEFPAAVHIYDRVIVLSNANERFVFAHGVECGYFIAEETHDKDSDTKS